MSLLYCPECGHEISDAAVACPNCGRPVRSIPVVEQTVVHRPPRDQQLPKWAFIPVAVIAALALLLLFIFFYRNWGEPENVNLKVTANRQASETRQTAPVNIPPSTVQPPAENQTMTIP